MSFNSSGGDSSDNDSPENVGSKSSNHDISENNSAVQMNEFSPDDYSQNVEGSVKLSQITYPGRIVKVSSPGSLWGSGTGTESELNLSIKGSQDAFSELALFEDVPEDDIYNNAVIPEEQNDDDENNDIFDDDDSTTESVIVRSVVKVIYNIPKAAPYKRDGLRKLIPKVTESLVALIESMDIRGNSNNHTKSHRQRVINENVLYIIFSLFYS